MWIDFYQDPVDVHLNTFGTAAAKISNNYSPSSYRIDLYLHTHLTSCLYRFTKCTRRWFTMEHVRHECILCCMHYEGALFHVFAYT